MEERLNLKQQQLVLENKNLVHYIVNKLNIPYDEHDEMYSIGIIGLIKAAKNYDRSRGTKFATLAAICIRNEILMNFRVKRKYKNDAYLDDVIGNSKNGDEIKLIDTIASSDNAIEEKVVNNDEVIKITNIVLNCLKGKERIDILYHMADLKQQEMVEFLGVSKASISRIIVKVKAKAKIKLYYNTQFKEVFKMEKVKDFYQMSFATKDVKGFYKIFGKVLQNLKSVEDLVDFKISCNNERVIIRMVADLKAFQFIGQIMQEIDSFSMTYESNKNICSEIDGEAESTKKEKQDEPIQDEEEQSKEDQEEDDDVTEQDIMKILGIQNSNKSVDKKQEELIVEEQNIKSAKPENTEKKESTTAQIKNYILTLDYFSSEKLRDKFKNASRELISQTIHVLKKQGLIESIERGYYKVTK